ncbi:MAG: hypothetical protein F6K31_07850 [Symploca sp. SIO2G7]|nr:hypothetical protein [Symploca sp. SIO2G7]
MHQPSTERPAPVGYLVLKQTKINAFIMEQMTENKQITKSLEELEHEEKVAILLYSLDSVFPTQITYVDVDCNILTSQIEALENLPALARLKLAEVLLTNLQQSLV